MSSSTPGSKIPSHGAVAGAEQGLDFDQIEAEQPDEPTYEQIDAAVNAMYELHGYWADDGEGVGYKDLASLRRAVGHVVMRHVVTSKPERKDKAITRGNLVKSVFPQLPAERDEWDQEDRPELAEQVHKWIDRKVWDLAKPDFTGQVQQIIGDLMDGMVLVRTKITADKTDAVYVTNDLGCLLEDFAGPWRQKAKRTADGFANNLALAVERIPEHASQLDREFKRGMKVALNSGASVLGPALTAAIDEDEDHE